MITDYAKKLLDRKAAAPAPSKSSAAPPVAIPAALARFPHWMKPREVAEYLGVSLTQVLSFRDAGVMEFINISAGTSQGLGADWRISKDSVAMFEASRSLRPLGEGARRADEGGRP